MGMFEAVMLAIMECKVVLVMEIGMQMDPGLCRWAKLSHLQHTVDQSEISVGDIP